MDNDPLKPSKEKCEQEVVTILQWNADGIHGKIDELEDFLRTNEIDVACIQESKEIPTDKKIKIEGFTTRPKCRLQEGMARGGGVIIFVREDLDFQELNCTLLEGNPGLEGQTVEIPTDTQPIRISNVYLPPDTSEYLKRMGLNNKTPRLDPAENEIIVGDVNAHHYLWDKRLDPCPRGEYIANNLVNWNATVLNTGEPTRKDPVSGELSAPDLTVCRQSSAEHCSWETITGLNSDHCPIIIKIQRRIPKRKKSDKLVWNWRGADWKTFEDNLERRVEELPRENARRMEDALREAILAEAYQHVGMKKVGTRNNKWMTSDIHEQIEDRNEKKKNRHINKTEYEEADKKVKDLIAKRKQELWRKKIDKTRNNSDMWRLIKSLSNGPNSSSRSQTIIHNGIARTTNKQKAHAFNSCYRAVSKILLKKEDRTMKAKLNKRLREQTEEEVPFTRRELDAAIDRLDTNKAAGPDLVHAKMIAHMGPKVKEYMLNLFNEVWRTGHVPQQWRTADIRPIPKKGKDLQKLSSFRPISLTSVVGKLMERMVTDRLMFHLESKNLLTPHQAGFRKWRSTEDQLINLSQHISDSFQKPKMERTVLALIDFSKAYDTVWRDGLLWKLLEKGVSGTMVRWTQNWLRNRLNFVTVGDAQSQKVCYRQGVPQGSVISPILFLVYIDDIVNNMPDNLKISLFADDVAIYASSRSLEEAEHTVQLGLDKIAEWSEKWKLNIAEDKCVASFFSTATHDSKWRPRLTINSKTLKYKEHPKFLGIKYDRQLTFTHQAKRTAGKVKNRARCLLQLAGTDWGYEKQILRTTYLATGRSVIEYGSPAWHPWLSKSSLEHLEKAQRFAGRTICGLVRGSPNDAALLDANLPSVSSRSQQSVMMAYDKSIRLKPENPRRQTADTQQRMRTMKPDWRENSRRRWTQLFDGMEPSYFPRETDPRVCINSCEFFYTPVRKTDTEETQRRAGEKTIEETSDVDVTFYTDGSAEEGTRNGGAGVVVIDGSDTLLEFSEPAGQLTSSFQAEMTAIRTAVRQAIEKYDKKRIRIVTDSRSSLDRIKSLTTNLDAKSALEKEILDGITQFEGKIRWVWCPSHCGVEGNEKADRCAARGCSLEQKSIPLNFDTAKAQIRKTYKDEIKHELCKKVYTRRTDDKNLSRKEQVTISRLRCGHHPELRYWRKKINEIEDDTCRLCGTDSETAEHVLIKCPGIRDTIPQEWDLPNLVSDPKKALEIWEIWRGRVGAQA